jgi:hypothetical protein
MRERLLKEVLTSILPKNDVTRRRKWVCVCVWVRLLAVFQWERKGVLEAFCRVIYGVSAPRASECMQQRRHEKREPARRGALKWLKTPTPAQLSRSPAAEMCGLLYCSLFIHEVFIVFNSSPWSSAARVRRIYLLHESENGCSNIQPLVWITRGFWRCAPQSLMLSAPRGCKPRSLLCQSGGAQVALQRASL